MAHLRMHWLLLLPLSACAFISDDHEAWRLDPDDDGIDISVDCDSTDATIGAPLMWHMDLDGDGFGDPSNTVEACTRPDSAVSNSDDCWDDADNIPDDFVALNGISQPEPASVYPGAENALYDGINQSCTEDPAAADEFDGDGDGFLSAHHADRAGQYGTDCVDGSDQDDPNLAGLRPEDVNTDATEVWYDGTDADCDGNDCDQDGDGYDGGVGSPACTPADCDDEDANISPDSSIAEVYYNGVDDNCDISVGDQDGDRDGDGYWAEDYAERVLANSATPMEIPDGAAGDCWDDEASTPSDFVAINGFKQPVAAAVSPAAAETWWDAVDQDCAGDSDFDADRDGYGYDGLPDRSGGYGDDCYDAADQPTAFENLAGLEPALVNVAAVENFYDGTDADCDGNDDDQDGDGFAATVAGGSDCDDAESSIYPGAPEIVGDGVDGDCDGSEECYVDDDGDGYRLSDTVTSTDADCDDTGEAPASAGEDCDDDEDQAYPGAAATCEDLILDNDCDGIPDDCLLEEELTETAILYGDSSAGGAIGSVLELAPGGDLLIGAPNSDMVYIASGTLKEDDDLSSPSVITVVALSGASKDQVGSAISGMGDVNGDGTPDILLGASALTGSEEASGGAWLLYGPVTADLSLSSRDAVLFSGTVNQGQAGAAVSGAGDMDGDGYDDVLIGAPSEYDKRSSLSGAAYLFYGGSALSSDSLSNADAVLYGSDGSDSSGAGSAVTAGIDMDGDGYSDLAISAQGSSATGGGVYLLYGYSSRLSGNIDVEDASAHFSGSDGDTVGDVLTGGDLDGDGYDELLISGPDAGGAGMVYAISGQLSEHSGSQEAADVALVSFAGVSAGEQLGSSVALAADISGDGHDDLWLGAAGYDSDTGAAYLFYGPFSGKLDTSDAGSSLLGSSDQRMGHSVAGAADVTGDSWPDLLVGAPQADGTDGLVYIIEGTGY